MKNPHDDASAVFRRFVFGSRGVYLFLAQGAILVLKHMEGSRVELPMYLLLFAVVVGAQLFRTWAAGFVGTAARGRDTFANTLLTAGPYAYIRNPMYLGSFVVTTALSLMSGLWYAPMLAWTAYAFVYSNVIPYEEEYLRKCFGGEYESYQRAVPRLLPALHTYSRPQGAFRLEQGLSNEIAAWLGTLSFCLLYWLI